MFEGKIHAIITSLIGAASIAILIVSEILLPNPDDKWYLGLLMGVLVITLTIILDIHYINPDYGVDAAEEHPILYGRPGYTPKSFDEYSEGEVWLWRLDGYFIQLFLFALSITPLIISWTR
jgi:hypothetical protein